VTFEQRRRNVTLVILVYSALMIVGLVILLNGQVLVGIVFELAVMTAYFIVRQRMVKPFLKEVRSRRERKQPRG
jgi:hypothetical protein